VAEGASPSGGLTQAELNRRLRARVAQLLFDDSGMQARGTAIYALADPRDALEPRYIGQTRAPRRRLLQHIAQARLWLPGERPWWIREPRLRPLYEWLRALYQDGDRLPVMIVREWVDEDADARAIERARIHEALARQLPLLNYEREVLGRQLSLL
jgi:hypothetical protein